MNIAKVMILPALVLAVILGGCFGSDSKSKAKEPTSFVTLKGSVTAPQQVESTLLGVVLTNADTNVRDAFRNASIYVNGYLIASFTIDSSSGTSWPVRLYNVPESGVGRYAVHIAAGKVVLKSNIFDADRENFAVNIETTAAALLAEALNKDQQQILASYPAIVNLLKVDLNAALTQTASQLGSNFIGSTAVTSAVAEYKGHITAVGDFDSNARLAYLQKENDLDGDGIVDLQIVQVGGGQRVRFFTALATATSLFEDAETIDSYSDNALLSDFAEARTSEANTFSSADRDFAVGLYLSRSASADRYIKILVRRIDLSSEGVFSGVVVEYSLISTATTAITTGQKTLLLLNGSPIEGAVLATDFLQDGIPTDNNLAYISAHAGIGCYSGNQSLVAVVDGQPALDKLSSAPRYSSGMYFTNTAAALEDLRPGRTLEVGDVFSVWFPATKNYALFKVRQIDANSIMVDFKVNSTPNEPRF
jgi:hypothetical protein